MTKNYMHYDVDKDGVLTATMDDPNGRVNVMNAAFLEALHDFTLKLKTEKHLYQGVILTSAKSTFFAGGDLVEIMAVTTKDRDTYFNKVQAIKKNFRRLETLGIPIVAAINGAALGGGYEICLACHHRIAFDNPKTIIGLPEITLGLLPGGGGVIRLTRKLKLDKALHFLLTGQALGPKQALDQGLIEAVTADRASMMTKAKEWILSNPSPKQSWDISNRPPASEMKTTELEDIKSTMTEKISQRIFGDGPGPATVLACAIDSVTHDFDTASTIETNRLVDLAISKEAKTKITAFFDNANAKKKAKEVAQEPASK